MKVAIVSADPLLLDGLVAIMGSHEGIKVEATGANIRETIRSASLEKGTAVLVDVRGASDRDLDYLVGAQEFGQFQVFVIGGEVQSSADHEWRIVPASARGQDLIAAMLGSAPRSPARAQPRTRAAPTPRTQFRETERRRGRPREFTNSLPLSSREYQAAELIASGHSNRQVAEIMGIKDQSAKNLVAIIARKLKCDGRVGITERLAAVK